MLEMNVKITGIDEVFKNLDATKADSIRLRALKAGAKIEKAAIEAAAPEQVTNHAGSNALPPGALKNDVVMRTGSGKHYVSVQFGKYTAYVARFLEYGFAHAKHGKFVQRPFFRNAIDSVQSEAQAAITKSLSEDISKAFKGNVPSESE